jgi:hypothetical protein
MSLVVLTGPMGSDSAKSQQIEPKLNRDVIAGTRASDNA